MHPVEILPVGGRRRRSCFLERSLALASGDPARIEEARTVQELETSSIVEGGVPVLPGLGLEVEEAGQGHHLYGRDVA